MPMTPSRAALELAQQIAEVIEDEIIDFGEIGVAREQIPTIARLIDEKVSLLVQTVDARFYAPTWLADKILADWRPGGEAKP